MVNIEKRKFNQTRIYTLLNNSLFQYAMLGVLLIVLQFSGIMQVSQMRAIGRTVIYSVAALGFCLLLGYSGQASLGTAGMMGLGSYFAHTFFSSVGLPVSVVIVLVALSAVLMGAIIGFISLRIQGIFLAIVTLGLSEILVSFFKAFEDWTGGPTGAQLEDYPSLFFGLIEGNREVSFCVCVVVLVLLMCMTDNLIKSPTGRAMLAMKNSTTAAQAYGIGMLKLRLLAFVLSTMYAAVAGVLYMLSIRSSAPTTWNLALSLNILGAVILGGSKSIWGVVCGVFVLEGIDGLILQNIPLFQENPNLISIFTAIIIILVVMFYPGGIPQIVREIVAKIKKANQKRKGGNVQ